MKDVYNNTLKEVRLLVDGKIKSLRFYKVHYTEDSWLDDERVLDATNYLDGKCCFYTLKDIKDNKYGVGLELKLVKDNEEINCLYEDLGCRLAFDRLTKEEEMFLNKIDKLAVPTFHYYMTHSQLDNIRFDLMKYIVGDHVDFEVFYSDGLVIINKEN